MGGRVISVRRASRGFAGMGTAFVDRARQQTGRDRVDVQQSATRERKFVERQREEPNHWPKFWMENLEVENRRPSRDEGGPLLRFFETARYSLVRRERENDLSIRRFLTLGSFDFTDFRLEKFPNFEYSLRKSRSGRLFCFLRFLEAVWLL